jgi:hypothetical protein
LANFSQQKLRERLTLPPKEVNDEAWVGKGDILGTSRFHLFTVCGFIFGLGLSAEVIADEPLKRLGSLPMKIGMVSSGGSLLMQSSPLKHWYLWTPTAPGLTLVRPTPESDPERLQLSWSTAKQTLLIKDVVHWNANARALLYAVNLQAGIGPLITIPETRTLSDVLFVSPDETEFGFFEQASSNANTGWVFPLAEYLWDVQQTTQQPTGFYLQSMGKEPSTGTTRAGAFSPENSRIALIQSAVLESSSPAFGVPGSGAEREIPLVKIIHRASSSVQTIALDHPATHIQWVGFDELLVWATGRGFMSRIKLSTEQPQRLATGPMESTEVSADGRFVFFAPPSASQPGAHILFDLQTQEKHSFQGVSAGTFTPDSTTLIVSRTEVLAGEPFLKIDLKPYREQAGPRHVDLGKSFANYPMVGEGLPIWAAPQTKTQFQKYLEITQVRTTALDVLGWDLSLTVKNHSNQVLQFDTTQRFGLVCELVDENNNVVVTWTPEDQEGEAKPPLRLAPSQTESMDCGVVVSAPPPTPLRGKIRYWIREYEAATQAEIAVP